MLRLHNSGCVYAATNITNGRRYIGKTKMALAKRIRCHKSVADRGKGQAFHRALRKYGHAGFAWEVLYVSPDEAALYAAEIELIASAKCAGERLYNRSDGGEGATGLFWSPSKRAQLSCTMKGRQKPLETRLKLSAAHKGRTKSPDTVEKIRRAKIGKRLAPWSVDRRAKMEAAWARRREMGLGHSEDTKRKQSEAAKRRFQREGEREKCVVAGKKGAAVRWRYSS
jgi:group I intron endonuclease